MSPIKNVAIIGGSGNVGRPILEELVAAGFKVTALTRATSTSTFPESVTVKKVDFSSPESLKEAFAGQDAVVSAIATVAVDSQEPIIDAAIAAGVKRYIPSEFGVNTRLTPGTTIGKILAGKVAVVDYLKTKESPNFSWTGVSTGMFFDWGLKHITGIDFDKKTVRVVDSGNEKFQASNLHFVGKAVASILKHPEQTANKYLSVASFNVSVNEIIKTIEQLTGTTYAVDKVSSADLEKLGADKLAKGDYSAFGPLVTAWNYADGANKGLTPETSANELLGLKEEDLKETVKAWLVKEGKL
ncbi:NAD(P)-binding protein [Coniochaeta ligniaria NRRL 30616]|uniref:NAD(P)-binding protein n=1 Tax=Coniochaeta ligniaria NRRL 30616 TaxID=1408157 RepID=A0A1J7J4G2_9PEZI|nr:NAD(P)-binding protein [Coniochaeta ligniaria NRRL 30616]